MADAFPVFAHGKLDPHELKDIVVLNPGGWFGRTWLLEILCGNFPLFLVAEADSREGAIEELADHPKYGHHILIDIEVDGVDYGFEVHPGDIVFGADVKEHGWCNLKGEFLPGPQRYISEPWVSGGGLNCDLDNLLVHGQEGRHVDMPWPCIYTSPGDPLVPAEGMTPLAYDKREDQPEEEDE